MIPWNEMKIIKKGKLPSEKIAQSKCPHCGCIVEVMSGECRYVSDFRDGDAYVYECPTCKHEVWVAATKFS